MSLIKLGDLFGRSTPVHLEVGLGKGTFILNQARAHPDVNFLGIEWANKYYRHSVDRMKRWQIKNVCILRADAGDVIRRNLADETIAAFHIYFPDPWPKKRHHKRRFFQPDTIAHVVRILQMGGQFRIATDHNDYFEVIQDVMLRDERIAPLFQVIDFLPTDAADEGEWVGSNFERKYIKEGRSIYTLALKKVKAIDLQRVTV